MMKIAICDDVLLMAEDLKKLILEYFAKKHIEVEEPRIYLSGMDLIKDADEYELIFLDIAMPQMDGIETGKIIRKKNSSVFIIVETGIMERCKEAFEIMAYRLITKPFDKWEIERVLDAVMNESGRIKEISFYRERNRYFISQDEIEYMEAYNGYVLCHTPKGSFRKDISLDKLENHIDKKLFYRIHRKYIVNIRYIQCYKNGIIYIGDKELSVVRERKKAFERMWEEKILNGETEWEELQSIYYKKLLDKDNETAKFRHDINEHLLFIYEKAKAGEMRDIEEYVSKLNDELTQIRKKVYNTGNSVTDILINYYIEMVRNIAEIKVMGIWSENIAISKSDLCVIIGNIMKNAVYEINKSKLNKKYLYIELQEEEDQAKIIVENSMDNKAIKLDKNGLPESTGKDNAQHGIGMGRVMETVEKNNGIFKWKSDGKSFTVIITFFKKLPF